MNDPPSFLLNSPYTEAALAMDLFLGRLCAFKSDINAPI